MLFNGSLQTNNSLRQKIRDHYRADENSTLQTLLPIAEINVDKKSKAWEFSRQLVIKIRKDQKGKGGVDALLNEFSLSSDEGVVLMCLAEALLRVPDKDTIDSLIRDKLIKGDWSSHIGNSDSLFVNASSWGLLFTGKIVNYSDSDETVIKPKSQLNLLKRTVGRLGEPVIRQAVKYAMKIMGTQFVMGHKISEAIERAKDTESKGYTYSYDMLGEGARTMEDAQRYFNSYQSAIEAIGKAANNKGPMKSPGISIKLSAIHPRYELSHRQRVIDELVPKLRTLALAAMKYDIGFTIDAEEANRLDFSLDIIEAVYSDSAFDGWDGFGMAVQAYQKRSLYVIEWIRELTQKLNRKMMIRLVKGAYWDSEIKDTQVEGYNDFPVFTQKAATDVSYQACAKKLLEYRDSIYPQFATHNAYTVATIIEMAENNSGFEFQRLHGMGESLYDQVLANKKIPCRVYAPVGKHSDLLAYLVRRLLENGANSSFVNNIVDEKIPVESLLSDPVETVQQWENAYNENIPQSVNIYQTESKAGRINSKGIDLTDIDDLIQMRDNLLTHVTQQAQKVTQSVSSITENTHAVTNPANIDDIIGYVTHLDESGMKSAINSAELAFNTWSQTQVNERANILLKTADALEANRDELIALCIKEAGKTVPDSVSEIREAVDFCRYYAARAIEIFKNEDVHPRGVALCISPWNFPLAIFLGQISAAIVTGNTVIAKPAEQTSLIALRTLELMLQCGLPKGVVEIVIAHGSEVGQHIVPDARIKLIMFTGSTETGNWISQKLAERDSEQIPLIAETGGQNCMIVDSTALPEQVVDDVIASGFQSAGQRCSALRVLFVQEDIADKLINMIKGAMKELHVADPSYLSTDIGPVIDQKAHNALTQHVEYLEKKSTLHYVCDTDHIDVSNHYFFAPRLYEISDISLLKKEVFGPIVHVIRYKSKHLEQVIDQINATGFGLTMGIHTRIEERSQYLAARSKAGNVYINRNMIGAVVGVQPFGGRGLSGTGPKAGGPNYLTSLVQNTSDHNLAKSAHKIQVVNDAFITHLSATTEQVTQVEALVVHAKNIELAWGFTPLSQRISIIRQAIARMASDDAITLNDKTELSKSLSIIRTLLIKIENTLKNPTFLPGPTGESNILHLESRGLLVHPVCEESHLEFYLTSILAAIACGNCVIVANSASKNKAVNSIIDALLKSELPSGVIQMTDINTLTALLQHNHINGAVIMPNSHLLNYVKKTISARKGAILPILSTHDYISLFKKMMTEKTVTIDTTAAGGNASLMTM